MREVELGGGCDELMAADFYYHVATNLTLCFLLIFSLTIPLEVICMLTPICHFEKFFHVLNKELALFLFRSLSCFTQASLKILNHCEGCLMFSWQMWFEELVFDVWVFDNSGVNRSQMAACWKFCILSSLVFSIMKGN